MMKQCKKCIEFLADYLDGELPEEQRAEFEMHLNLCPPCREYLDSYRETIKVTRQCMCDHPGREDDCQTPPKMPESLVQAILHACKCDDDKNK